MIKVEKAGATAFSPKSECSELSGYGPPEEDEFGHELSVSEAFRKSVDLARRNYLQLLPVFLGFGVLAALFSASITAVTPTYTLPSTVNMTQSEALAAMGSIVRYVEYVAANYFVTWIVLYVAAGIGILRICVLLDRNQKLGFSLDKRASYASLAVTTILAVAIIEISGLIIIGPLIFGTMLYLSLAACAVEGKSTLSALGRSRALVSGKWGKTFLVFIGVQIIIYIGATVVSDLIGLATTSSAVTTGVQNFVLALEFPLVSASMVVLYLSYRRGQEKLMQRPPSLYDNMAPQPMGNFGSRNFCSACGVSVSSDEKFCHNCGAVLSTQ
jgi:hypothetical protein